MKKIIFIVFLVFFIILAVGASLYYFPLKLENLDSSSSGFLTNPAQNLAFEEAVLQFDESFVYYLLASLGAYKLHNPPFSSDTPKIEFYISNEIYNAEIIEGKISIGKGEISREDIIIRTSKEEAVKMMLDKDYVGESFREGFSSVEFVASEAVLFSKGYLKLYEKFK